LINLLIGEILVNNINTKDKSKFLELRKNVGIVFQNPENQIVFNKVYDDIAFGLNNLKFDKNSIKPSIENALKKVNMLDFINSDSYELSLGQKQRIAIASILATNPNIIIFDEPTTMLDPKGKKIIYNIAKALNKEGFTIIYITNVIDEILMSKRIVTIEDGKIKHVFLKKDLLQNIEILQEMELELPTILEIIIELRKSGVNIELTDFTKDELIRKLKEICKK